MQAKKTELRQTTEDFEVLLIRIYQPQGGRGLEDTLD